jgi:hypothetical protein
VRRGKEYWDGRSMAREKVRRRSKGSAARKSAGNIFLRLFLMT